VEKIKAKIVIAIGIAKSVHIDYASSFILFPIKTLPIFINFMSRAYFKQHCANIPDIESYKNGGLVCLHSVYLAWVKNVL